MTFASKEKGMDIVYFENTQDYLNYVRGKNKIEPVKAEEHVDAGEPVKAEEVETEVKESEPKAKTSSKKKASNK